MVQTSILTYISLKYYIGMSYSLIVSLREVFLSVNSFRVPIDNYRVSIGSQIQLAGDLPFEVSKSFHSFQHALMRGE